MLLGVLLVSPNFFSLCIKEGPKQPTLSSEPRQFGARSPKLGNFSEGAFDERSSRTGTKPRRCELGNMDSPEPPDQGVSDEGGSTYLGRLSINVSSRVRIRQASKLPVRMGSYAGTLDSVVK